jgi:hypothetical protein
MPAALQGLLAGGQSQQPAQAPSQQANPDTDPNNPDYEPPESGPFRCDNCTFYADPNQCSQKQVVQTQQGVVDPAGCCKFFASMAAVGGSGGIQDNNVIHQYGK